MTISSPALVFATLFLLAFAGWGGGPGGGASGTLFNITITLFDFITILFLLAAILGMAGVLGVLNWRKPERAYICFFAGCLIFAFNGLYLIINLLTMPTVAFGRVVFLLNTPVPLAYTLGAHRLKRRRI